VLFLTAHVDPDHLAEAIRVGAAGYVLKDAPLKELIGAIHEALEDRSPINRELAMGLLQRLLAVNPDEGEEREEEADPAAAPSASSSIASEERPALTLAHRLTPREIEVLRRVARGRNNQQIASELLVSVSTVKKHMRQIVSKLGVSDRTQAAVRAIELGLGAERDA
jgi:DNA-binding NarL/FixJ family response regulator